MIGPLPINLYQHSLQTLVPMLSCFHPSLPPQDRSPPSNDALSQSPSCYPPRHHSQGCNGLQRAWGHVHVRGSAPDAGRPLYIPDPCPPHPAALLGPRSALLTTCSALDSRPPVPFCVSASPGDPSALSLIPYRQPCSPQESYPKDQSRLRNLSNGFEIATLTNGCPPPCTIMCCFTCDSGR